jgi:hypothetical protein
MVAKCAVRIAVEILHFFGFAAMTAGSRVLGKAVR